jgi:hypothetical protein
VDFRRACFAAHRERNTAAVIAAWSSAHTVSHASNEVFLGTRDTPHSGKIFIGADSFSLELRHLTLAQVQHIARLIEPPSAESP